MRTPKFNLQDVELIKAEFETKDAKVVAENCNTSYQTIMKIKNGTYTARSDERSGLRWNPVSAE